MISIPMYVPFTMEYSNHRIFKPCIFAYYAVAALVIVFVTMESSRGDEIVNPSLIPQPPERCDYKDFLIVKLLLIFD